MFDKKSKNRLSDIQKETIMEEVIKESNKDGKITKNIETRNIETRNTETKNFNNEKIMKNCKALILGELKMKK